MGDAVRRPEEERGRGREATRPLAISRVGWRDVLLRTKRELSRDNASLVAAGVAFYGLLAAFPAIAGVVSLYGIVADPASAAQFFGGAPALPQEARTILAEQAARVAATPSSALGLGLAGALLLAIYSASKAVSALLTALNIAYEEQEKRGFVRLTLLAFGLTAALILFVVFALLLIVGVPAVVAALALPKWMEVVAHLLPWPILAAAAITGLSVLYRMGPSREPAAWLWVRPGAVVATVLWLLGSMGFSFYVANFGSYNETYGSVGAIVVMLMWLWVSAYVVILGAELNAEIEHQTKRDTTTGRERDLGERGAYVADTIGEVP